MANVHKPDENMRADSAFVHATLNSTSSSTIALATYYPMTNYDLAWYLVHIHTNAGLAGSISAQMHQRVGAAGGTAVLKAAQVITAVGVNYALFARGEDFTATYTHIGIRCTEGNGSAVAISAVLVRMRARYKQATMLA